MKGNLRQSAVFLVLALFASVCIAYSAQTASATAVVTVAVTDQTGAMVPGARVRLSPPSPVDPNSLVADRDGKLTLDLSPGTYQVSVDSYGFRPWTGHLEVSPATDQTVPVVLMVGTHSGPMVEPVSPVVGDNGATHLPGLSDTKHFDGQTWWNDVKYLADDKLEGRDTGSRGERMAEEYAVDKLKAAGAGPAGANGFYQPVRFVERQIVEKDCSLALVRDGKREPLVLGDDAIISTRIMPATELKAPLVFAGYGLNIPEKNYNDFAGLDAKGKVVVILSGSPAEIPGALASHYQTAVERWKMLKAAGAIGMITLMNPAWMDVPWQRMSINRTHPSMDLDYPEFDETKGEQLAVIVNPASADKLLAGSGHTFEEIALLGKDRKALPHFPLTVSLEAKTKVETRKVESANIVGILKGSDPQLAKEYVVLSAHIDHVGIGAPVNGDRIYNGAMDNGSGSALVLDMAANFHKYPEKLRRSVLLLLITGEEKGLLGSKYFAAHPTVPAKSIVADVNVDMFRPIIPLKVLTVYGLDESDLGDRVREAAQTLGVPVQPDPEPLRNIFIRSDQYNFIRHGVPAVMIDVGFVPGTPEQQIMKDWLTHRYHAPSDDVNQPVDLQTAAKYEEIIHALLIDVANADARPQWKQNSFFRRYAAAD